MIHSVQDVDLTLYGDLQPAHPEQKLKSVFWVMQNVEQTELFRVWFKTLFSIHFASFGQKEYKQLAQ